MTNETNCSCGKPKYIGREVCYDCYKEMFYDYKESTINSKTPKEHHYIEDEDFKYGVIAMEMDDTEPDFELKHEVAQIKTDEQIYFVASGPLSVYGASIHMPKRMVFNPDARVKDYDKLVLFLLENMTIYDNAKGFDKVSYMFKEDKS